MFIWTDKKTLKGMQQYMQALGTIIMHKTHTMEILATYANIL
jgi:hypothetical protein